MISKSLRFLATAALLLGTSLLAEELPILIKARARLGTDAALDAVRSIHFVGKHETTGTDKPVSVPLEIIIKKPYFQRITVTYPNYIETTGLSNYEGWMRRENPNQPGQIEIKVSPVMQLKALRANTWENLAFYRGLEQKGGRVVDLGPATKEGVACQKVTFIHDNGIEFIRYFELATGRLVFTETGAGGSVREEGEMIVSGIRFPKKVILNSKTDTGKDQLVTVTFDKITINEQFDDSIFAVPPRPRPVSAPPAAKK